MLLVDTDVMIDVMRNFPPAILWLQGLGDVQIGLPGLVSLELIQGCRNRTEQQRVKRLVSKFARFWPTSVDCERALEDFTNYGLSQNLGMIDALIAQTAVGLNAELATFNEKHYRVIANLKFIQPYSRS